MLRTKRQSFLPSPKGVTSHPVLEIETVRLHRQHCTVALPRPAGKGKRCPAEDGGISCHV